MTAGTGHELIEPIALRVLGHDDGGEDLGHVGAGLAGHGVAAIELPEVRVAGAHDGLLDVARAPVVGGHGEVPVAELRVQGLDVAGVGARGLFGIEAVVEVAVAGEAVLGTGVGHELPHAASAGAGVDDLWLEAGLGHGEVDEILRDAFVFEDLLDEAAILADALKGCGHVFAEALRAGEDADVAGDLIVDDEGEIGGDVELGAQLGDELGVGGEGEIFGLIEGVLLRALERSRCLA